jgi:hypothetical protein
MSSHINLINEIRNQMENQNLLLSKRGFLEDEEVSLETMPISKKYDTAAFTIMITISSYLKLHGNVLSYINLLHKPIYILHSTVI